MKDLIKNVKLPPCCEDTEIDTEHVLFNIYSSDFHGNWLVPDYKGGSLASQITQRKKDAKKRSESKFTRRLAASELSHYALRSLGSQRGGHPTQLQASVVGC